MAERVSKFAERDVYLKVLGLRNGASLEEIKTAYRTQAKKCHPDKNPDDPNAKEKFQELNNAVRFLTEDDQDEICDDITDYFEADDLLYHLLREYIAKKLFQQRDFSWKRGTYKERLSSYKDGYNHYANSFDDNSDTSEYSSDELFEDIKEEKELLNVLKEKLKRESVEGDGDLEDEVKKFDSFQKWEQAEKKNRKEKKSRRGKEKLPPKPKPLKKKDQELQEYRRKKESEQIQQELLQKKLNERERQQRRQHKEELKRLEIENQKKQSLLEQASQHMEDTVKVKEKRKMIHSTKNKAKQEVLERQKELERIRNTAEQKKIYVAQSCKLKKNYVQSYKKQDIQKSNEKYNLSSSHKLPTGRNSDSSTTHCRTDDLHYTSNLPEFLKDENLDRKNLNLHSESEWRDHHAAMPPVNIWEERKAKQQCLDNLFPKNAYDEEEMFIRAIQLSKQQAAEDEKMRNGIFGILNDDCLLPKQDEYIIGSEEHESNKLQEMLMPDKEFVAINQMDNLSSESHRRPVKPFMDDTQSCFTNQSTTLCNKDGRSAKLKNKQVKSSGKNSACSVINKCSDISPENGTVFKGSVCRAAADRDFINEVSPIPIKESVNESFLLEETPLKLQQNTEHEPFWDDEIETVETKNSINFNEETSLANFTFEYTDKHIPTVQNEPDSCDEAILSSYTTKMSNFADGTTSNESCHQNSIKKLTTMYKPLSKSLENANESGQSSTLQDVNECTYKIQYSQHSDVSSSKMFPEIPFLPKTKPKHDYQLDEHVFKTPIPEQQTFCSTITPAAPKQHANLPGDHLKKDMLPIYEKFPLSSINDSAKFDSEHDGIEYIHDNTALSKEKKSTTASHKIFPLMHIPSQRPLEQNELEVIHELTAESSSKSMTSAQTFLPKAPFPDKDECKHIETLSCDHACISENTVLEKEKHPSVPIHKTLPGVIPYMPLDSGLLASYGLPQIPFSPFSFPVLQQMYSPQFHEIWQLYFKTLNMYYAAHLGISLQGYESLIKNIQVPDKVSNISSMNIPSQTSESLDINTPGTLPNLTGNLTNAYDVEKPLQVLTTSSSSFSESKVEKNEIKSVSHSISLPNFPTDLSTAVSCHETLKDFFEEEEEDIMTNQNCHRNSIPETCLSKDCSNICCEKDNLANRISSSCSEDYDEVIYQSRSQMPLKEKIQKEENVEWNKREIKGNISMKGYAPESLENNMRKSRNLINGKNNSSGQKSLSKEHKEKYMEMNECNKNESDKSNFSSMENNIKRYNEWLGEEITSSEQSLGEKEYSGWSDNKITCSKQNSHNKEYTGWSDDDAAMEHETVTKKIHSNQVDELKIRPNTNTKLNKRWTDYNDDESCTRQNVNGNEYGNCWENSNNSQQNMKTKVNDGLPIHRRKTNENVASNKRENTQNNSRLYQEGFHKSPYVKDSKKYSCNFQSSKCRTQQKYGDCDTPWSYSVDKIRQNTGNECLSANSQCRNQRNDRSYVKHCKSYCGPQRTKHSS